MRSLCDAVDLPSSKARALIEDVATGRAFFGGDGFLPAFYELDPLFSYLPESAPILIEDPPAVVRALREELERARSDEAARGGLPHFPLEALYLDETELERELARRKVISAHRSAAVGGSWQIVPTVLPEMLSSSDSEAAGRVMEAMLPMKKIDIAELERAFAGELVRV